MKTFYPTYLYVKTHNITGLKYFGKTTGDPFRYYGSGKHWIAHLRKHGYNISTEVIGYYTNSEECKSMAEKFTSENNIVESTSWANLIPENGLDGGATYRTNYGPMSDETKRKLSESKKGRTAWNKGTKGLTPGFTGRHSEKSKEKIRLARSKQTFSDETRKKMSDSRKGKSRPEASKWLTGRTVSEETRRKMSDSQKGRTIPQERKDHLSRINKGKVVSDETKEKLKGYVVVVSKDGRCSRISKEDFYSQPNIGDNREFVFHNSPEGKRRKKFRP